MGTAAAAEDAGAEVAGADVEGAGAEVAGGGTVAGLDVGAGVELAQPVKTIPRTRKMDKVTRKYFFIRSSFSSFYV